MITASVFIATSLDGFIAREDGALDWLPGDDCEPHGYDEFMATVDAIVMGRKTFEVVMGFGSDWPFTKLVVVLSSTQPQLPAGATCEWMSGDPQKSRVGSPIGDGSISTSTAASPSSDSSPPDSFSALPDDITLEHIETKTFRPGVVQSEYRLVANNTIR